MPVTHQRLRGEGNDSYELDKLCEITQTGGDAGGLLEVSLWIVGLPIFVVDLNG